VALTPGRLHWLPPHPASGQPHRRGEAEVPAVRQRDAYLVHHLVHRRPVFLARRSCHDLRRARWDAAGYLTVDRPVLQVGGEIIEGKPKSRDGARRIWLDADTVTLLRAHRKAQLADRLRASSAWQDHDLVFCRADGSPWTPDYVTHRFRKLAEAAGVPVIKLHEGRHSATSLQRDAEVDPEIRRKTMGHADAAMTSHYTHIEAEAHRAAAEAVARLVEEAGS
jgi:integrase